MNSTKPDPYFGLCKFQYSDGRRCTMSGIPGYNGFCRSHGATHRRTYQREDNLTLELHSPGSGFITQIDINHVLGKLFDAVAANRMSPKRAATLAYIGNLLAQTQKGARKEAANWQMEADLFQKITNIKFSSFPSPAASPAPSPDSAPSSSSAHDPAPEEPAEYPLPSSRSELLSAVSSFLASDKSAASHKRPGKAARKS